MAKPSIIELKKELRKASSREKAGILKRFFKTGPGEYGEGDVFIGVRVPDIRRAAKKYFLRLDLGGIERLLRSHVHEERFAALIMFVMRFNSSDDRTKKNIFTIYLNNTRYVNNWDLVDLSSVNIVGQYLKKRDKAVLYALAASANMWERRISIVSTLAFMRNGDHRHTLDIAEMLIGDREDLIHKASGWMLREVGKRDRSLEESFLEKHSAVMPRTMLRYAIEKLPEKRRRYFLDKKTHGKWEKN